MTQRERLQNIIDETLAGGGEISAREFRAKLQSQGVTTFANLAKTGKMNGFSYQIDGIYFKSSSLGKKYTYQSLKKRGITFDQADRNAFSKTNEIGENEHESRDITKIRAISEHNLFEMYALRTATILDSRYGTAGNAAVLQQFKIADTLGQQAQADGMQHFRGEVKTQAKSAPKYDPTALSPAAAARRAEEKARRQAERSAAQEVAQSIDQAVRATLDAEEARKAKAAFSHVVAVLQYKQPGHNDLRQALPPLLLQHADRIVKLKHYPAQKQATAELFETDDGGEIAKLLLSKNKQQEITKR